MTFAAARAAPRLHRRDFLRVALAFGVHGLALTTPFGRALAGSLDSVGPYGPLLPPDADGIQLPEGFTARLLAESGSEVGSTGFAWHAAPDGGAVFKSKGDSIYVSNSEAVPGGVSALRLDKSGEVLGAYPILEGSRQNCAGGATPWGSWLSCEEVADGLVWECDPEGLLPAVALPALGSFRHEAACYDKRSKALYLTEDEPDGCFYRFLPERSRELAAGVLQVAVVDGEGGVSWQEVPNPNPGGGEDATRHQVGNATAFDGGEGIACAFKRIFFTTKGDDRVWRYDPKREQIDLVYDRASTPGLALSGVDNIAAAPRRGLVVAEDGGNMELVLITRDLEVAPIFRLPFQGSSELTGPAFDRRGRSLFVSSQRGESGGRGLTYQISGPFKKRRRR